MAATRIADLDQSAPKIPVRKISNRDLREVLVEGLSDFSEKRGDLLLIAMIYPIVGIVAAIVSLGGSLLPLFFPIAAGIGLLGPLVAIGFYELARRREAGLESDWSHFLDVRNRPAWESIGVVSGLLLSIFAAWLITAAVLYALLIGEAPVSVGDFLQRLFLTSQGWALIVLGNLAGAFYAVLVLKLSVVSLPMLVDRNVSARVAVDTSVRAVRANMAVMIRWGLIVATLLVLGSIPAFIGLAFVLPWLGYATWHLYTRLVDRDALP
ncbi:MAG: hypothetical protein JWN69_72 [Alphaproteobacteria bacterium]|nr:hypothetical protein [Alphaproteobacteria bacterium]